MNKGKSGSSTKKQRRFSSEWDALFREEQEQKRAEFRAWFESTKDLPSIERAEAWLKRVASKSDCTGDCESLVYLKSRGIDCSDAVSATVEEWKQAAQAAVTRYNRGHQTVSLEGEKPKFVRPEKSIDDSEEVSELSVFALPNFWIGYDHQERYIDATMLRTVEWCDIGGFDGYWKRLANEFAEDIIRGGVDNVPASFTAFDLCRSNYAISLMRKSLERVYDSICLPAIGSKGHPWVLREFNDGKAMFYTGYAYIAHLAFVEARLYPEKSPSQLVLTALDLLIHAQSRYGAWSFWSPISDEMHSIEATAKAIHALALVKPRGWSSAVQKAQKWLLSKQDEVGMWRDDFTPDPVYLTVMVLDALSLAEGGKTTFCSACERQNASRNLTPKRFDVAFSFPGEERSYVKKLVEHLVPMVGRGKIFYDEFFRAELALPDSDLVLQDFYSKESKLIVVLLTPAYATKEWCGLEWRAVREIIKSKKAEQILFLKKGEPNVRGIFSFDGYIDIEKIKLTEVVDCIYKRTKSLNV